LMNESISRAAGASHGQEFDPVGIGDFIRGLGRLPRQRSTLYNNVVDERRAAGMAAPKLQPMIQTPANKYAHGEAAE